MQDRADTGWRDNGIILPMSSNTVVIDFCM